MPTPRAATAAAVLTMQQQTPAVLLACSTEANITAWCAVGTQPST